jgi:hypothetical protein
MTPESALYAKLDLMVLFLLDREALSIYELFRGKTAFFKSPRRIAGKSEWIV